MTDRVWDFPDLPIQAMVFYVPGASIEGGFTVGGARITSPEPGGRSALQLQLAMQVGEWENPWSSWIMSKTNGQIFRVKLALTPQLINTQSLAVPQDGTYDPGPDPLWDVDPSRADLTGAYASAAPEGSNVVTIDMARFGKILRFGHLIGHMDNCYTVDDISYAGTVATVTVTPPLRKNIAVGDVCLFRPNFLGTISNGSNIITPYDAANNGLIQLPILTLSEAVI